MIVHNFDPVLIDLGIFQIRWYSLAYIAGIILGWVYAIKIIKINKKKNNFRFIELKEFDDLLLYLVFGIIIGGRLGYAIFYDFNYYAQNFLELFKVWRGGMSFHGGLLGIITAIFIFAKRRKVNFLNLTDIIACAAPIGLFLGRVANFINGELVGKTSTLPWAVVFPNYDNLSRLPSQIYEAFLEGVFLFIFINFLALKKQTILKSGHISSIFLISYSLLRILSEYFREPDEHIGYLFDLISMGSLLSIITLVAGFLMIFFIKNNEQNN